jgi:predicted transport protein
VNIIKSKSASKAETESSEIEKYTVEGLTKRASPGIRELFSKLRDRILGISDAVWEKVGAFYCDYRTTSTFTTVQVLKNKLRILIKMGTQKVNDPQNICKPIPPNYGYGLLNTQFEISNNDEIEYAMTLIMQAYDYVSE